jgi:serine O-acetyltransferase
MSPTLPEVAREAPDWSRETPGRFWDPSKRLLRSIRRYQHWQAKAGLFGSIFKRRWVLSHRFWSVVTGADIPLNCQLGGGLLLPHPNGIVIHPAAVIGNNCLIFQQVTIGQQNGGVPVLHDHVDVGAGAKILGKLELGANSRVGANAVVLCDVARGTTVVGIPARVLKKEP